MKTALRSFSRAVPGTLAFAAVLLLPSCVADIDEELAFVRHGMLEDHVLEDHDLVMSSFASDMPWIQGGIFSALLNASNIQHVSGNKYKYTAGVSFAAGPATGATVAFTGNVRVPEAGNLAFADYPVVEWNHFPAPFPYQVQVGRGVFRSGKVTITDDGYYGRASLRGVLFLNLSEWGATFDVDLVYSGMNITYSGKVNGRKESGTLVISAE